METNTSTVILKGIENNNRLYRGGKRVDQQRKLSKMEARDTQEDPFSSACILQNVTGSCHGLLEQS